MARHLARELGLGRVLVAELQGERDDGLTAVASVAAQFTADQLRRGTRSASVGARRWRPSFAASNPGLSKRCTSLRWRVAWRRGGPASRVYELVRQITEIYPHSRATYLHAPSIVDSAAICDAFHADRSVQAALAIAARSEVALVGIGEMAPNATLFKASHVLSADREALLAQGAVGSMNARFYDARRANRLGISIVAPSRSHGASHHSDGHCRCRWRSEDRRHPGRRPTGCIDVLVTDERTAAALVVQS